MRSVFALLAVFSAAVATPAGQEIYHDAVMHYQVRLPEGWRAATPEELRDVLQAMREVTGLSPRYDAWFQRREEGLGGYPYVVITHQECDTQTPEEIAKDLREKVPTPSAAARLRIREQVRNSGFSDVVIDAGRNCVLCDMRTEVALGGVGPVHARAATFPGRRGVVTLIFYSHSKDFRRDQAVFQDLLSSFRYDEGYGYEEGLAERRAGNNSGDGLLFVTGAVLSLIIVGAIFGLIWLRTRSGRKVVPWSGERPTE